MNTDEVSAFRDEYRVYAETTLRPAEARIASFFEEWRSPGYWPADVELDTGRVFTRPSPVRRVRCRVKGPDSVVDKINRQPERYPGGFVPESFYRMHDCVAARLVVYFLSDLPRLDDEIRANPDLELPEEPLPVAYLAANVHEGVLGRRSFSRLDKRSGYASIHYVLRLRDSATKGSFECPWFELQVRTLAQDVWGDVEHLLGYKTLAPSSPAVRRQFQILSAHLGAIDEHFDLLYQELRGLQRDVVIRSEDDLDPWNLPRVLGERRLECAQVEVEGVLQLLNSRGIRKVSELRQLAGTDRLSAVEKVFEAEPGYTPAAYEVVAALAALSGVPREGWEGALRSHMQYARAWDRLRTEVHG